jgi:hypothetical protein
MLSTPTSRSRAEVRSAEKPPPMKRHSTVSLIASRGLGASAYVSISYFRQLAGQFIGVLREPVRPVFQSEVALFGELELDAIVKSHAIAWVSP